MPSTCAHILEVCVRIQLGYVCRPYVCIRTLVPRNPNSTFLLLFLYSVYIICFCFVLFYAYKSLFLCLFVLRMLDQGFFSILSSFCHGHAYNINMHCYIGVVMQLR